jgi:predicted DNA-binding transcriptional regulator AlpA
MDARDRLVTVKEAKHIVGVSSHTTFYALVNSGELPKLIKRGRNSFLLQSDLDAYVARLAATRKAA